MCNPENKYYVKRIAFCGQLWYNKSVEYISNKIIGEVIMDIRVGDVLSMKKKHPCGSDKMIVLRAGMDFRLKCQGCGHEFMTARNKIEKNIRKAVRSEDGEKTGE